MEFVDEFDYELHHYMSWDGVPDNDIMIKKKIINDASKII